MNQIENYYTEAEVSRTFKISRVTLRRRRWLKQPPEYVKCGGSIRYPESALLLWARRGGK
jgi:hypothetical protein